MSQQSKKTNDFKDKLRLAEIVSVDPQNKMVDIRYTTQDGKAIKLDLSYQNVGLTWGRLYCPQKGDSVVIDQGQGDKPIIVGMKPKNAAFLPYLDPGELAETNSDGSFIHLRNKRRRVKSTGELIDYDATKGPNGETDIETEPGGMVIGIRSKKDISTKAPRWYEHSYLAMYDNGDISLQSRYQSKEKGLLFFDGAAGYTIWTSGDGRPQEYIELDSLAKRITIVTDGDVHQHVQTDWKITVYDSQIQNISDALQINVGKAVNSIPGNFKDVKTDSDLNPGDIRIDNSMTPDLAQKWDATLKKFVPTVGTGKFYIHTKGDYDLTVDRGNVNITAMLGGVTVNALQDVVVHSSANTRVNATGNVYLDAGGGVFLNNEASSDPVVTRSDLKTAIQTHTHPGVQTGTGVTGPSPYIPAVIRKVFA